MFLAGKVVLKLWNVYIIKYSSQGKLFLSSGMYISSCIDYKESCFQVAECVYHHGCITREAVLKLRDVYIIKCSSQEKLF